jgi:alpha-N-arabinofuranosidase
VAVVNATDSVHQLDLNVSGVKLAGSSTQWQITGKDLDATDRVGQPPQVELKEIAAGDVTRSLSVAPISINIYRIPVVQTER